MFQNFSLVGDTGILVGRLIRGGLWVGGHGWGGRTVLLFQQSSEELYELDNLDISEPDAKRVRGNDAEFEIDQPEFSE